MLLVGAISRRKQKHLADPQALVILLHSSRRDFEDHKDVGGEGRGRAEEECNWVEYGTGRAKNSDAEVRGGEQYGREWVGSIELGKVRKGVASTMTSWIQLTFTVKAFCCLGPRF